MYNLFVSADENAWQKNTYEIDLSRCVNEHTDEVLKNKYGHFDSDSITFLKKLPCIFAYESYCKQDPKLGRLTKIVKRQGLIRIEYEIIGLIEKFTYDKLENFRFELDINKMELHRTHWALKDVDLDTELRAAGIRLPGGAISINPPIDIESHFFDVALSFPGESRTLVEAIANGLERQLGAHKYFYDNNYTAQLARPSLDTLLQDIYRNRSKLVAVFLSGDYQRKAWCGVEFGAIKEVLMERRLHNRLMLFRLDDGHVDGIFNTDGYIDCNKFTIDQMVGFIKERVHLIRR